MLCCFGFSSALKNYCKTNRANHTFQIAVRRDNYLTNVTGNISKNTFTQRTRKVLNCLPCFCEKYPACFWLRFCGFVCLCANLWSTNDPRLTLKWDFTVKSDKSHTRIMSSTNILWGVFSKPADLCHLVMIWVNSNFSELSPSLTKQWYVGDQSQKQAEQWDPNSTGCQNWPHFL